jgi:hypothetical protein
MLVASTYIHSTMYGVQNSTCNVCGCNISTLQHSHSPHLIEVTACNADGIWTIHTQAPNSIFVRVVHTNQQSVRVHGTSVRIRDTYTNELFYDSAQTTIDAIWCRTESVTVLWEADEQTTMTGNDTQTDPYQIIVEYRVDGKCVFG